MSIELALNQKGKFQVSEPFDKIMNQDLVYTVLSIRTLKEIYDSGHKPYEEIYELQGLTIDDYELDFGNNEPIIGLGYGGDTYHYIPKRLIVSAPPLFGKQFSERTIMINMGNIPIDFNLDEVLTILNNKVKEVTGIKPSAAAFESSARILVGEDDYLDWDVKRQGQITESCEVKYQKLINEYDTLVAHKNKLEKIIEDCDS